MKTKGDWKVRALDDARRATRRWRDRTWRSWFLAVIDVGLGLGWWWFRPFTEVTTIESGSVWKEQTYRISLSGHRIAWGKHKEYYDSGSLAAEGFCWLSPFPQGSAKRLDYRYWSRDGVEISEEEYLEEIFGKEAIDEIRGFLPFTKSSNRS